ncbi:SRF-like protein [Obba rivulosa]|uniref:SRF-like protein n=1 Tax=Obba rivulosa TaxID=1052685 RepID=A0A8E2DUV5_9APHY|nr:SRF-like protein [Obba rivulosa]
MGRRKIEIQPITHERNRSVTFLKRKNGLFKKAYELGVLCSVDVAVIIFEERPGHHVKLYQYCSTDVHSMVQRHLRFDGEKDTRGPADFNNTKVEEAVDDDEDIDDDEGNGQAKRRDSLKSGKVKVEGNGSGSIPIRPAGQQSHDSVEVSLCP